MANRILQGLGAVLLAATLTACGASTPSRFYTLDPTASAADAPPLQRAVLVGPVTVPAVVDRPQFVVQVAPNRVEMDDFNRWAGSLNDAIARAVVGNLVTLLGTTDVAAAPLSNFNPAFRVTIDVQRFDTVPGESVLVDAVWAVRSTANGETRSGHSIGRETVKGSGYDALAAAHSRALAQVSADIATAIRAAADSSTPPTHESKGAATKKSTAPKAPKQGK